MILAKEFYQRDTNTIAKELLGCFLVHETPTGVIIGKIVETESYLTDDPACHGYNLRLTERTKVMFGDPGHAYIYFTYGMYYMFNITTAPIGVGEAVLIRALEPVEGVDIMFERRKIPKEKKNALKELCSGPAKLVLALGITSALYGHNMTKKPLYILSRDHFRQTKKQENNKTQAFEVITTTRIGISAGAELPLRFYIKDNEFISKK